MACEVQQDLECGAGLGVQGEGLLDSDGRVRRIRLSRQMTYSSAVSSSAMSAVNCRVGALPKHGISVTHRVCK